MRVLGAILCGGLSSRFGADKALAELQGVPLIEHVRQGLGPQVDGLLCCGRAIGGMEWVADRPRAGLGPLGGLNAALHHAAGRGFDAVLSVPCDTPLLPADLRERLGDGPAFVEGAQVIGIWPSASAPVLDALLAGEGRRSILAFAEAVGARPVAIGSIANVNAPADLARLGGDAGRR